MLPLLDTHVHFWDYSRHPEDYGWITPELAALQRDCLPEHLLPVLKQHGVTRCIAVQARAQARETGFLLDLCAHTPALAGVVGWEDLRAPDLPDRLDHWRSHPQGAKLKGLRHQVQDEPQARAFVESPEVVRGLNTVQDAGLVYSLLVFHHQWGFVSDWAARHDRHWLVLDHLGKPAVRAWQTDAAAFKSWHTGLRELARQPHVVGKLSGLATEASITRALTAADRDMMRRCWDSALDAFGPERLMYGSDWPVLTLADDPEAHMEHFLSWLAPLSPSEQAAIATGTAQRVYALDPVQEP